MGDELYSFVYRCRLCNKTFTEGYTGKKLAFLCLSQTILEVPKDVQHPGDTTVHYADDHIGIADLVGIEIRR